MFPTYKRLTYSKTRLLKQLLPKYIILWYNIEFFMFFFSANDTLAFLIFCFFRDATYLIYYNFLSYNFQHPMLFNYVRTYQ